MLDSSSLGPHRSVAELRRSWEQAFGVPPPQGLGRDLLTRGLAWKAQEQRVWPLPRTLTRELARLAAQLDCSGNIFLERRTSLKPGTRLVRDWHGRTYHVSVLKDGFLLDDRIFSSLSKVAQAITGTKWSGPRFFGLIQCAQGTDLPGGANGQG